MSLLVVGSVGLDDVETPHGSATQELGGSAVYFSFAASHFAPVRLAGVVGADFPAACAERMARPSIDLAGLHRADGNTFRWHGRYEGRMDEADTVDVQINVLGDEPPPLPAAYADSAFVFLANGPPETQLSILDQVDGDAFAMADTMNFWIDSSRDALLELMGRVDGMVMNDAEALQLSGRANLPAAARWVCERGPRWCVVKKGEHGVLLRGPDGLFVLPGFPHEGVVDPTGAGDSFAGGLMGYLAGQGACPGGQGGCPEGQQAPTAQAVRHGLAYGTVMASFAIEEFGPRGLEGADAAAIEGRLAEFVSRTHLRFSAGP